MALSDAKHAQPSVALTSFDAAACYVPFHFSTRHWGIHVWKSGLLSLVSDLIGHTRLTVGQTWIVGFAWQVLFLHELFHHWVEVGVARAQAPHVLGDWKFFDSIFCALYPPYVHDRPSSALEEALANALVANQIDRFYHPSFRSTAEYRHLRTRILRVMDAQPWPYCDYVKVLSRTHHAEGLAHLMDRAFIQLQLNKTGFPRRPSSSEIMPPDIWFTGQRVHGSGTCPVYFIDDMPAFPLVFSRPFPKWNGLEVLVHPNDHKPPHIHAIHLGTREERRFTWDDLRPLDAEPRRPVQRDVHRYCDHFRRRIDKRVKSMPWA